MRLFTRVLSLVVGLLALFLTGVAALALLSDDPSGGPQVGPWAGMGHALAVAALVYATPTALLALTAALVVWRRTAATAALLSAGWALAPVVWLLDDGVGMLAVLALVVLLPAVVLLMSSVVELLRGPTLAR